MQLLSGVIEYMHWQLLLAILPYGTSPARRHIRMSNPLYDKSIMIYPLYDISIVLYMHWNNTLYDMCIGVIHCMLYASE